MNTPEVDIEKKKIQAYYEKNYWKITFKRMAKEWRLYLMFLPLVFVFICWRYIPMYGLSIAFKHYDNSLGIMGSNFVGLAGFKYLIEDPMFWKAFRNTFMLAFYGLIFGFPIPIILALLFSEVKNTVYRSILQVFSYLPKFVSLVVVTSLVTMLCNARLIGNGGEVTYAGGIITQLLISLHMIEPTARLVHDPQYFRAVYQVSGIWEAAGYGSIVYFAAILSISPTSYEAARMDGANKWAQIKYVTFPGIASTLTIMLILEIGKLFTVGYEKVYLLYDPTIRTGNLETADIVATYVMRASGMTAGGTSSIISQSIAASADLFNAIIAMLLVIGSNMIARKISDTSLY